MYLADQPDFLNLAATGSTELEPLALLDALQAIEAANGRDRARELPKGPRTLDIDLLLFGELVLEEPRLKLPHPGVRERGFVLVPLLELAPDLADPRTGMPYARFLAEIGTGGVYPEGPIRV